VNEASFAKLLDVADASAATWPEGIFLSALWQTCGKDVAQTRADIDFVKEIAGPRPNEELITSETLCRLS
jgi:hypothetical protein